MSKLVLFYIFVGIFIIDSCLGAYEGVIFYYFLAGLFWYLHERYDKSPLCAPLNPALGAAVWPYRSIRAAKEYLDRLYDPERFVVGLGDLNEKNFQLGIVPSNMLVRKLSELTSVLLLSIERGFQNMTK